MKYAYLTCELKSRDLDSRLLIAAHLLRRGISVVIGQQWSILYNAQRTAQSVVLLKTANRVQGEATEKYRNAGATVILSDEEVLSITNDDRILLITDASALRNCHAFLAQDEHHKSLVKSKHADCNVKVVGNCRVDLLRSYSQIYEEEAQRLRAAGRYILVNTNLTLSNNAWGDTETALKMAVYAGGLDLATAKGLAFAQSWIDSERANNQAMMDVIGWMTQSLSGWRIVVRPHPAENFAAWQAVQGIEVVVGTNPLPWIKGADLMIHTNSTTGLEALLLDRPCLNLCPMPQSQYSQSYVTRNVNAIATSTQEATQAIEDFLRRGEGPLTVHREPPPFLRDAAETTAEIIRDLAQEGPATLAWTTHDRQEVHRSKFFVGGDEFSARAKLICETAGVNDVKISALDDSLFLMRR